MKFRLLISGLLFSALLGGCGGPDAVTEGMSNDDAKAAIEKMSPENKIRAIASSPMNQQDKDKKYAEIEAETGVKASDVLGGQGGPPPKK